jgi:signal transduction histidine kinase
MTGTGLGLKIVRDIVESYGGEVYVAVPENNYSTTIRVEIPKDKNEEHE